MRHNDVIHLISVTYTEDEIGNQIPTETERMIYANEFTIGSSEFYSASAQGMKPEKQFEVYSFEYDGETKLKHQGMTYSIIRTQKKGEKTRITCQKDVGNG